MRYQDQTEAAAFPRQRGALPEAIETTVARIARGFDNDAAPPSLADLLALTGELEESLLGRRYPSRAIAQQISLWYAQLPRDVATALTARALAERTRFLLHDAA
jgi:hypothetical protein